MIPVDGHKNLFRDEKSGAIVNCDTAAYNEYVRMRDKRLREKSEIEQLKSDIDEIKTLLREIVNGSK